MVISAGCHMHVYTHNKRPMLSYVPEGVRTLALHVHHTYVQEDTCTEGCEKDYGILFTSILAQKYT